MIYTQSIKVIHNVKSAVKCIESEATWIRDKIAYYPHVGLSLVLYENGGEMCSSTSLKEYWKGKIDKYQEEGLYFASQVKDIV